MGLARMDVEGETEALQRFFEGENFWLFILIISE